MLDNFQNAEYLVMNDDICMYSENKAELKCIPSTDKFYLSMLLKLIFFSFR